MIAGLANIIADFFISKEWTEEEEREIYRYGSEVIIATLLNIIIVVLSVSAGAYSAKQSNSRNTSGGTNGTIKICTTVYSDYLLPTPSVTVCLN